MKIIFLGAPGAGKGTQAAIVSQKLSIPTISTGEIIRESVRNETPLGKTAKELIEKGELVPDNLVIELVRNRISQDDCKNGFILDGFPRTIEQAKALSEMGVDIDAVVNIFVSDADIIRRMGGRRTCSKCSATYHTLYNPSAKGECCEKCGEKLSVRADDSPETVKKRLEVYHRQTQPLEDYYNDLGKLVTVVGQEKLEDTTRLTLEALKVND
ncbi:MAG: adenylate kinase [Firmicutes bacterium]|nr:adenylate kinase [Bacillota bacterium]